jgi:long-chain acyl-CoA synthetase
MPVGIHSQSSQDRRRHRGLLKNPSPTRNAPDFISQQITEHLRKSFGEIPQKFLCIAEDFSVDNGMLTWMLKLVRRNVMKIYSEKLNALYDD